MKKFLFICLTLACAALTFVSCNKEKYPTQLSGEWLYSNGSTGYSGSLSVYEQDGKPWAGLHVVTPTELDFINFNGEFKYNSKTGEGTFSDGTMGGYSATVKAKRGTDKTLEVIVSQMVSGGADEIFRGGFNTADKE
ncbi:MAG: hypothetical protein MJY44_06200 [Bacteroidales bacterium]|nr:hypothetical protein [Bacteroidales bacterium]